MSVLAMFGLALALASLAALPGSSVLLVVACSLRGGVKHGAAAALGIVLADLLFIGLALAGVAALAQTLGGAFMVIKVLAALFLLGLGIQLCLSASTSPQWSAAPRLHTLWHSGVAGFVLTLADVKAVVFYASLLPLFVDFQQMTRIDMASVVLIAAVAVGGVKLMYAVFARSLVQRLPGLSSSGQKMAGAGLIASAGVLLLRE